MRNYECNISIESQDSKNGYNVTVHDDLEKGILFYKENNNTITTYDYKNDIFVRENDEMRIEYHFCLNQLTENKVLVKTINNEVTINILTKKLEKNDNYIEIIYEIENNEFIYKIKKEMEV